MRKNKKTQKFWLNGIFAFITLANKSVGITPNNSGSNLFSFVFRRLFEHQMTRAFFGLILITFLLISGLFGTSVAADFTSGNLQLADNQPEMSVVGVGKEIIVTTEKRFQMPVELIGVSQGFKANHPGIDLRAPLGSNIQPIAAGIVREVIRSKWGYGQAIIIEHRDGYSSMYAHAGKIFVDQGASVDQGSVIANVGMTGYTTGPHLHLEVYLGREAINPQPLIVGD